MKKSKKAIAGILAVCLTLGTLTACGGSGKSSTSETEAATSAAVEAAAAEEAQSEPKENSPAEAAAWEPAHDITIRVPNAAGGSMDTATRILGQGLQESTGSTVMVENLTGASGAIAANDLLSKDPDPCELMTAGIALFTLTPLFNQDVEIDLDDFSIVCGMLSEDFVLCVNPEKSGIGSWEELKTRGENGRIIFGSNTPGGATHMLATALFGEAGLNAEAVTSDGTNKDMLALTSGDVDCVVGNISAVQQFIEEGTAVPVAVFSAEPYVGFEGFTVPSVLDLGYDIQFRSCNFLMARSGADPAALRTIREIILAYTETDECAELAETAGFIPDIADGESVRAMIENSAKMCQEIFEKYY